MRPSERRTQREWAEDVAMTHLLCDVCGMSATMVVTDASEQAWADHMAIHPDPRAFSQWSWWVQKLF